MSNLVITHSALVNTLGAGKVATLNALLTQCSGLTPCDFMDAEIPTWIGRVGGLENQLIQGELANYDSRNNRLALFALQQDGFFEAAVAAKARYGADRIGLILGTSTSSILETECAFRQRDSVTGTLPDSFYYTQTHELSSVVEFTRRVLGLHGPCLAISTACSSSAKAFASAQRLMNVGLCDAVIVGGVDSLCFTTLYGFSALELLSTTPCRPADMNRDGISIGEAAGFALLETRDNAPQASVALLGYGESTDAHHMSTPHPEGLGASLAMQRALHRAALHPSEIDYINLHGTASKTNDKAEDYAINACFGANMKCSSTKGYTGHTLGAAGITEAIISMLCIEHNFMPSSIHTEKTDPEFHSHILLESQHGNVNTVLSNSFGFGGNNCTLIFGKVP